MNYLLLFLSVGVNVTFSAFQNYLGKSKIKSTRDNYIVNALTYGVGAIVLMVIMAATFKQISLFTVALGVLFGLATACAAIFQLKAYNCGPMSFTVLIVTASMIIPAFSGKLIWGEELSFLKVVGTVFMVIAAYFATGKGDGETSLKWLSFALLAFFFTGSIGVMQKIQQTSKYATESTPFLAVAFVVAAIACLVCALLKKEEEEAPRLAVVKDKVILPATLCGVFIVFLNVVNLYLSGVLPSVIFFPMQNGGTTVLSIVCAILLFKEKLDKKKTIGLVLGIVALVLLFI